VKISAPIRVLAEGADSMVIGSHLDWMKKAGYHVVLIDITEEATGRHLADHFEVVPKYGASNIDAVMADIISRHNIELVVPSVDEGLPFWASRREEWAKKGVHILVSNLETIEICQDKLRSHEFLVEHGLPSPKTQMTWSQETSFMKPRIGRGSRGVRYCPEGPPASSAENVLWQEYLDGPEFTVDLLCSAPGEVLYCVIRQRLTTSNGLSVKSRVVAHPEIEKTARNLAKVANFFGPVNVQFIEFGQNRGTENCFCITDINPRISGGQALTLDATENWFALYPKILIGEKLKARPVKIGRTLNRCFKNIFFDS